MKIKNILLSITFVLLVSYIGYTVVSGNSDIEELEFENILIADSNELYGFLKDGSVLSDVNGKTTWERIENDILVYYNGKTEIDEVTKVYEYVNVISGKIYYTTILYNVVNISYEEAVFYLDIEDEMYLLTDYKAKDFSLNISSIDYSTYKFKAGEKVNTVKVITEEISGDLYVKVKNRKGNMYYVKINNLINR